MVNTQLLIEKSVQDKKRARLLSAENVIRLGQFTSQMYVIQIMYIMAISIGTFLCVHVGPWPLFKINPSNFGIAFSTIRFIKAL